MVHFLKPVGRTRVSFGKPRDANAETLAITVSFAELADESHQIRGMLKGVALPIVVRKIARRIAAQRKRVLNARFRILRQNLVYVAFVVTDTRQVRDRIESRGLFEPDHKVARQLTRRTAGAIGHRNKRWL